jgi:hypothetical protein
MHLPFSDLSTNKLALPSQIVATYKFYWLIAIIELVENGQIKINKRDVLQE